MDEEAHQADNLNKQGPKNSLYFIHKFINFIPEDFEDLIELDLPCL